MSTLNDLKKTRQEKLEMIKKLGINPYPGKISDKRICIKKARKMENKKVIVAGRIMKLRKHGKIVFADLVDETDKIQLFFKVNILKNNSIKILDYIEVGDFIQAIGKIGKTIAGEISVFVDDFSIISKSLRPLPDQWYGLKDVEERYRQRYVDIIINKEVKNIFIKRSFIIKFLRNYLDKNGFLEVETPMLQPIYGGASAKPFITHHNALDINLYLRISPELYLKRLIVAGFEKVYEIGRVFRNEGIDKSHNPEFTMLEFYWAYSNYEKLMKFTEKMFVKLIKEINRSLIVEYQGEKIDFTPPWDKISYRDALLKYTGIDINIANTEEKLKKEIESKNIKLKFDKKIIGYGQLLDSLYKQTTRSNLKGPIFLTERPTAFVSLAKRLPNDPSKTASFQLLVHGEELINAYNELNDPIDQSKRWRDSEKLGKKGANEYEAFDDDYIRALEYGMPPTAGWGLGIDRLTAILTNQKNIKDTILFPTLRPEK